MEQTPFRIGGIYRQMRGQLVRLEKDEFANKRWQPEHPGHVFAFARKVGGLGVGDPCGFVSLINGRFCRAMTWRDHPDSLIPGECDEQGNPITEVGRPIVSVDQIRAAVASLAKRDTDTKRDPLPYFEQKTEFDPFHGYFNEWDVSIKAGQPQPSGLHSPDLEPTGHRTDFRRVTASLLRGD